MTIGKETPTTVLNQIVDEFDVMDGGWAIVLRTGLSPPTAEGWLSAYQCASCYGRQADKYDDRNSH